MNTKDNIEQNGKLIATKNKKKYFLFIKATVFSNKK
jgi:hypothetical protein